MEDPAPPSPDPAPIPSGVIRSVVALPIAGAVLTGVEVVRMHEVMGGGLVAAALAVATGASMGLWPAVLLSLCAAVVLRRVQWRPRLSTAGWAWLAAVALAAVVLTIVAEVGIAAVMQITEERPVDYPQTAARLWLAGAALTIPVAVAGVYAAMRRAHARVQRASPTTTRVVALVAVSVLLVRIAAHLASGPFFVYLGAPVALGLWIALAIVVAAWWPERWCRGRAAAVTAGLVVMMSATGVLGLRRAGSRALLLHESRLFGHLAELGVGWLDGDADGDLPHWLGGNDCDDGEPLVSGLRPEIAGNGVDDNCFGGDRAPSAAPQTATAPVAPGIDAVVMITIDTLRADHLARHGYRRQTMPALESLAARGRWFSRAYSPANHTFFSIPALWSGQTPEQMIEPGDTVIPRLRYTTWLPKTLAALGFHSVAINPPLVTDGKLRAQDLHFEHVEVGHFDFVGKNRGTTAKQVADTTLQALEAYQEPNPLLLWVHFMDPHAVHESPRRFEGNSLDDAYDNELSWVDLHLNRILSAVERRFKGRALIVVTSDHGEALGDAGNYGHGFTLREPEIRVPLAVMGPGVSVGAVDDPVSTLGVAATILELLGQPRPPALWPSLLEGGGGGSVVVQNPAFLWNVPRMEVALIEGQYKLSLARATNTMQLFDLTADPEERNNLVDVDPDRVAEMRARLLERLETR